jgi:biopolymer transport protein ExbD
MPKRKKKHEPEMLIVSFCDIVTITTAALFFCLLITVQEAVKVPVFKPTPRSKPTNKTPVFFECRDNTVIYIDKEGLDSQVQQMLKTLPANVKSGDIQGFVRAIGSDAVGNEYYRVIPQYLLTAIMALEARPGAKGEDKDQVKQANSRFHVVLRQLDPSKQYAVFLVRDNSFEAFRSARKEAFTTGFEIGWELLGTEEPVKFGAGGAEIGTS